MYERLPENMAKVVNAWIKGKKSLVAIELPKNNNDNLPQEIIKEPKKKTANNNIPILQGTAHRYHSYMSTTPR